MVVREHFQAQSDLAKVGGATDGPAPLLGRTQSRQQQRREDRDDGDNHEQFDQGECAAGTHVIRYPFHPGVLHEIFTVAI